MSRRLYRIVSVVVGVTAGMMARAILRRVWHGITGDNGAPEPNDRDASWAAVVAGAALDGALVAALRATIDRAGALGVAKATGSWPD